MTSWVEGQRQAGKIYVDKPGEMHWFSGYGPLPVVGPCPHTECEHLGLSVIAWGPDYQRYELVQCGCGCRAWTDGGVIATSKWLEVKP